MLGAGREGPALGPRARGGGRSLRHPTSRAGFRRSYLEEPVGWGDTGNPPEFSTGRTVESSNPSSAGVILGKMVREM